MLNDNFIYVGTFIYLTGAYTYIRDTIRGKAKPNKVSFFLWSLATFIAFAAEVKQGVGIHSVIVFVAGFVPLTILIISFLNEKAYWKIIPFDIACGVLSILGLILWQVTKVGNVAIAFSILSDALAYIPTFRKSYYHPETENSYSYLSAAVGIAFTLLTIKTWTFASFAFPLWVFVADSTVFLLTWLKPGAKAT